MIGSLLLGLFDDAGALQHVGVCSSFTASKRKELAEFLEPYREDALVHHPWKHWAEAQIESEDGVKRMPGGQSRWSQGKDLSWEPFVLNWWWKLLTSTCRESLPQHGAFPPMANGQKT